MVAANPFLFRRISTTSHILPDGRINLFSKLYYTKTSYKSRASYELSIGEKDQLYLLDQEAAGDEWCVGKLGRRIGLVPSGNVYPAYQELPEKEVEGTV